MRYFFGFIFSFISFLSFSQKAEFAVQKIALPKELASPDNQFSGLFVHSGKLFFMSESRLQDKAEPKMYAVNLADIDKQITDSNFVLPFQKFHLYNLERLRDRINASGAVYEGLEAIVIEGDDVYFSVETATPSANCFLLKGRLTDANVIMDINYLVTMPKPVNPDGSHIYNAGFEAMMRISNTMYAFFEYNYFPKRSYTTIIDSKNRRDSIEMDRLPFRITDITQTGRKHFTAINYFYKGDGDDAVYRIPETDIKNAPFMKDAAGNLRSYCRLIDVKLSAYNFSWEPLWEFPAEYMGYNWEGIAAYNNGYFILNDKYTPARPYSSTLLYLKATKLPPDRSRSFFGF